MESPTQPTHRGIEALLLAHRFPQRNSESLDIFQRGRARVRALRRAHAGRREPPPLMTILGIVGVLDHQAGRRLATLLHLECTLQRVDSAISGSAAPQRELELAGNVRELHLRCLTRLLRGVQLALEHRRALHHLLRVEKLLCLILKSLTHRRFPPASVVVCQPFPLDGSLSSNCKRHFSPKRQHPTEMGRTGRRNAILESRVQVGPRCCLCCRLITTPLSRINGTPQFQVRRSLARGNDLG
mmetsp:Transcript_46976/g.105876  ORF Transcript_46976/g.105876 Transcript_46976/m.105876 type:complete len:242 (-) Transcript_46976:295-1020(-)